MVRSVSSTPIRNYAEIQNELQHLRVAALAGREIFVVYDPRSCYPGFGDLICIINLANYISRLVAPCRLMIIDDGSGVASEKLDVIERFAEVPVSQNENLDNALLHAGHVCFDSMVRGRKDTSIPSFLLTGAIFKDARLNPRGIAPYLPISSAHQDQENRKTVVGIHVRASAVSPDRNPPHRRTFLDLQRISALFPSCEIVWFGDFDDYKRFERRYGKEVRDRNVTFRYQQAKNFIEAAMEAQISDFWFQRWGGGIGTILWFSEIPYLMISNDFPLRRLYGLRGTKIGPWSKENQIYDLRRIRSRQRIPNLKYARLARRAGTN